MDDKINEMLARIEKEINPAEAQVMAQLAIVYALREIALELSLLNELFGHIDAQFSQGSHDV